MCHHWMTEVEMESAGKPVDLRSDRDDAPMPIPGPLAILAALLTIGCALIVFARLLVP